MPSGYIGSCFLAGKAGFLKSSEQRSTPPFVENTGTSNFSTRDEIWEDNLSYNQEDSILSQLSAIASGKATTIVFVWVVFGDGHFGYSFSPKMNFSR